MERLRGQRRGAKKIPPDHLYSSTLIRGIVKNQNPKRVCGRPVIIKNRANGEPVSQFPVLIRPLGIPRHLVAYRGDKQSCRILYPINGLRRKAISSLPRWSSSASIGEWSLKNSDFDIEQFVSKDGCGTRHSVRRTATAERIGTQLASAVKRWLR